MELERSRLPIKTMTLRMVVALTIETVQHCNFVDDTFKVTEIKGNTSCQSAVKDKCELRTRSR